MTEKKESPSEEGRGEVDALAEAVFQLCRGNSLEDVHNALSVVHVWVSKAAIVPGVLPSS